MYLVKWIRDFIETDTSNLTTVYLFKSQTISYFFLSSLIFQNEKETVENCSTIKKTQTQSEKEQRIERGVHQKSWKHQ